MGVERAYPHAPEGQASAESAIDATFGKGAEDMKQALDLARKVSSDGEDPAKVEDALRQAGLKVKGGLNAGIKRFVEDMRMVGGDKAAEHAGQLMDEIQNGRFNRVEELENSIAIDVSTYLKSLAKAVDKSKGIVLTKATTQSGNTVAIQHANKKGLTI